jgi:hypothetical protein
MNGSKKLNPSRLVKSRYHVPRSWLNPSGNLLVMLEEFGGDLSGVKLMTRTT